MANVLAKCDVSPMGMNVFKSQPMSRNHCDKSGDPARTVLEKRRVLKQETRGIQTRSFYGPNVNMSDIAREDRR